MSNDVRGPLGHLAESFPRHFSEQLRSPRFTLLPPQFTHQSGPSFAPRTRTFCALNLQPIVHLPCAIRPCCSRAHSAMLPLDHPLPSLLPCLGDALAVPPRHVARDSHCRKHDSPDDQRKHRLATWGPTDIAAWRDWREIQVIVRRPAHLPVRKHRQLNIPHIATVGVKARAPASERA